MTFPISKINQPTATSIPLVSSVRASKPNLGSYAKIASQDDDDAAVVLTRGRTGRAERVKGEAGVLPDVLKSLGDISNRLSELQDKLKNAAPGSKGLEQVQSEIGQLSTEYTRVVTSKSFKDVLAFLTAANQSLARGASAQGVYQGANASGSVVGGAVLGLIQRGETAKLSALGRSLDGLAAVDVEQFGKDPSISDRIKTLIGGAVEALSGVGPTTAEGKRTESSGISATIEAPQLRQLTFDGASDLALSLRSYDSRDLIKAAASGVNFDAQNVLILTANPPDDESKEKKKEDPEFIETNYRG